MMQSQPDSLTLRLRPFHPMTPMGGQIKIISRHQYMEFGISFNLQACRAFQEKNPFAMVLVVPFASRRGWSVRNDALQFKMITF